jgi:phosphatidylserine/phosphatidylglycerophosphate/cardiolipin synthase-like enzyme
MQLLIQPEDGLEPILKTILAARRSIDVYIFRLDCKKIEKALAEAIKRGVIVRTLIAHTNKGGEVALRKLELRLLEMGATVSRSADDLVRYHGKIMIVDCRILFVFGYNFTRDDILRSRSLGIATKKRDLVEEALRLFQADFDRKPYKPTRATLVVSPETSRDRLAAFVRGARRQLLIYGSVTDDALIRLLEQKARAGLDVRIIGKLEKGHDDLTAAKFPGKRLHVRAIVRDGRAAFVGSQGLRRLELEKRREIGVIVQAAGVVKRIAETFESDWGRTPAADRKQARQEVAAAS